MKIAILSKGPGNVSTKRLVEEAEKSGHEVHVINYVLCEARIEKSKPVVMYKGEALQGFDAIIPRIASSYTRYGSAMPIIIKLARGTHGRGVVLAETKKAAKSTLQAFYLMDDDGTNILLQEFVEESAGTDIRAFVVGGQVVASMKRQSLTDDFRSNLHQGGEGRVVKLTDEERRVAIKAARAMGLSICGVDMMRSKRGPLVIEVNSSPGFGIEQVTNRNVGEKIIEYVERNAKARRRKDRVGA
jgi:glutathione synthase/RimK-type ligase-like ATP-grasp enzyme